MESGTKNSARSFRYDLSFWPVSLCVLLLCLLLAVMNHRQFPILDGDCRVFLPIALNSAQKAGLVNPIFQPDEVADPAHPEYFTWHGFLYPMALGFFTPAPTYQGLRTLISLIGCAAIILSAIFIFSVITKFESRPAIRDLLVIAILLGVRGLVPIEGRPDWMVTLLLPLGLVAGLFASFWGRAPIYGGVLGLLLATSPIPGVIACEIVGIYAFSKAGFKRASLFLVVAGLTALATFALLFSFYPYTLSAWVRGMLLVAKSGVFPHLAASLVKAVKEHPELGAFIIYLLTVSAAGLYFLLRQTRQIRCPVGAALCAALCLFTMYYFGLRNLPRFYNLQAFAVILIPAFAIVGILLARHWQKVSPTRSRAVWILLGACLFLAIIPYLRLNLKFASFVKDGVPLATARQELQQLRQTPGSIQISNGFFMLTEDYSHLGVLPSEFPVLQAAVPTADTLMIQQVNGGLLTPPIIPGYRLVKDDFSKTSPHLFGFKTSNVAVGYNYAIYRRLPSP